LNFVHCAILLDLAVEIYLVAELKEGWQFNGKLLHLCKLLGLEILIALYYSNRAFDGLRVLVLFLCLQVHTKQVNNLYRIPFRNEL
jgi:hypothetical protein